MRLRLLVIANVLNVGADLSGRGGVTNMVSGVTPLLWTPLYAVLLVSLLFWMSYQRMPSSRAFCNLSFCALTSAILGQ